MRCVRKAAALLASILLCAVFGLACGVGPQPEPPLTGNDGRGAEADAGLDYEQPDAGVADSGVSDVSPGPDVTPPSPSDDDGAFEAAGRQAVKPALLPDHHRPELGPPGLFPDGGQP
jgi:hypothetical protein